MTYVFRHAYEKTYDNDNSSKNSIDDTISKRSGLNQQDYDEGQANHLFKKYILTAIEYINGY